MTRIRCTTILLLAVILAVAGATTRIHSTDAAWTDVDHLAAPVSSGYWPTSGNARAEVGRVRSVNAVIGALGAGDPLPWPGPTATRNQSAPGALTATSAGPYSTGTLGLVNTISSTSATGGAITGSVCASYSWGPSSPALCPSVTDKVYASGTLSSYRIRSDLLLGIGLDILGVSSPLSASATCDLTSAGGAYAATPTRVTGTTGTNYGTLKIRGIDRAVPAPGTTATYSTAQGTVDLTPAVSVTLTSTVQLTSPPRSTLVATGTITRLNVVGSTILQIDFAAVLMDVSCGPTGSAPTQLPGGLASARIVSPQIADTVPTAMSTTELTTTPAPATTTSSGATSTSTKPTTKNDTPITTTAEVVPETTTTETTTTEATTAEATSTTPPATTTEFTSTTTPPPTSKPESPVTAFETADGRSCAADTDAPTSFSCDDGSVLTFAEEELAAPTIVDGVWVPTTIDGVSVPVVSLTRG